ncbi:acyl carrier protein [Streptomyces nogalater]
MLLEQAAEVLGLSVERLDPRRSLRDYGIDSLSATRLRLRFRQTTDQDIPLSRLLGTGALRELMAEASSSSPPGEQPAGPAMSRRAVHP